MDNQVSRGSTSNMWKWLSVALFLFSLIVGMNVQSQHVQAADLGTAVTGLGAKDGIYVHKDASGTLINTPIKDMSASDIANWDKFSNYQLTYNYSVAPGTTVKDGDTAQVNLPDGTSFSQALNFPIKASDGTVIGTFSAPSGATFGHITFNDYYSTHNNDMTGTINLNVNGSNTSGEHSGSDIGKNGYAWNGPFMGKNYGLDSNGRYQYAQWDTKINGNKKSINDALITDTLSDTDKQEIVLDPATSTPLMQLKYDDGTDVDPSNYKITYMPSASRPTSFTIQWIGTLDKTVNLFYLVKITDPAYRASGDAVTLHNNINLKGTVKGSGGGSGNKIDVDADSKGVLTLGGSGTGGGTQFSINVKKQWDGVPTGKDTPEIIAVLYKNGQKTNQTLTLNMKNGYKGVFKNLFKYDSNKDSNKHEIKYTVAEAAVPKGYKGTTIPQAPDADNNVTLTNTYLPPETTSIKVNKVWKGVPKGVTTPDVKVTLFKNGETTDQTLTLTNANQYSGEFTNLPKVDDSGKTINYTVEESSVTGYTSEDSTEAPKDGAVTFTNQYIPKQTKITVKKIWQGVPTNVEKPKSIVAVLYENNHETKKTVTLNSGNNWTAEFTDLPETDSDGSPITYTVA